ncbi:hypothetical protein LPJ53_003907 [Coemansia erecta]|uniref:Major facilitator superfamily (MFS) profile domain-containing protein n=1 Tax=Coemansia erecta TaxID=147472 RepID=A0A9W7XYA6_9FUNG|nr:hypothetical protein LPJ53_003907 [Coemansia erecta]
MTPPTASNIAKTPSSASLDTDVRSCACKPSEECADCYDPSADEKAKAQAQAQAQARASMASKAYNGGSSNNDDDDGCDHRYGRDSWFAWAVVFAGCIQGMITLGASRAHGVYQEYYVLNEFATSPTASISWIGSLQNTLLNLCGVLVGILSQFVDSRVLSAGGSVVMGLAFVLASFSTQLWQLALTQGALYGAAASFPYILGVTVPMQWVGRNRGFALAVVYMGSGLGGMWISLLTRTCIESLGRQWSQRILGCIMVVLGVGLSPLIIARTPRAEGRQAEGGPRAEEQAAAAAAGVTARPARRTALDFSVVAERRFQLIALASFFAMGPNTIPYLLMPTYVADVLKETSRLGSSLVTIINVSGIFGRFAAGMLSDRFGPVNMLLLWVLLAAFSQLGIWLPFASVPAVIASAALFGVTGASIVGMLLNALSRLYGVRRITYISGLVYMTYAVSSLLVAQTASLMLDTVGHGIDYTWPIVYEGLLLVAAFFVLLALRLRISRRLAFKV